MSEARAYRCRICDAPVTDQVHVKRCVEEHEHSIYNQGFLDGASQGKFEGHLESYLAVSMGLKRVYRRLSNQADTAEEHALLEQVYAEFMDVLTDYKEKINDPV